MVWFVNYFSHNLHILSINYIDYYRVRLLQTRKLHVLLFNEYTRMCITQRVMWKSLKNCIFHQKNITIVTNYKTNDHGKMLYLTLVVNNFPEYIKKTYNGVCCTFESNWCDYTVTIYLWYCYVQQIEVTHPDTSTLKCLLERCLTNK